MQTEWDYTQLAKSYLKRPNYSEDAINELFHQVALSGPGKACDIGAGVAHLTLPLLDRSLEVTAVEPNAEMRRLGIDRTKEYPGVQWVDGTAEKTCQAEQTFDLATFGSSFNVTDRTKALVEAKRILKPNAWFAAMWNHRDLNDPLQQEIEGIIRSYINGYNYGTRREDQSDFLKKSGHFLCVNKIHGRIHHRQPIQDVVEAWRSHATMHRQAGDKFESIISDIEKLLSELGVEEIDIPYDTQMWAGQLK